MNYELENQVRIQKPAHTQKLQMTQKFEEKKFLKMINDWKNIIIGFKCILNESKIKRKKKILAPV